MQLRLLASPELLLYITQQQQLISSKSTDHLNALQALCTRHCYVPNVMNDIHTLNTLAQTGACTAAKTP
jgi:hypothetical protein